MHGGQARRSRATAGIAAITLAAASAGCGSVADALAGRDGGAQVAKVVVLVPDEGPHQAAGEDVYAAVSTALADVDIGDWDVVVEPVDDGTDDAEPLEAAGAVAAEVADEGDVIAVVGGLTPEAVRAAQRPLDERSIAFLSPADDERANTRGPDPSEPLRPYTSYFRTAIPDSDPLAEAAAYAVNGKGATTVVIVHGGQLGEAARLARHVASLGADAQLAGADDLAATVAEIETNDGPVAYYLLGDTRVADVVDVAKRAGHQAIVMGGERLAAGDPPAADGATFVSVVPASLQVPAETAVPGLADAGALAAPAYDAGRAVAQMLERCLPSVNGSARDARHGCLSELDTVSVTGALGHVTFDSYGDRPGTWPEVLVGTGDGWVDISER
ncbi:MAG TPA: hypothetical protein VFZ37_20230 [Jiangellaceae bacterium]